MSISVGWLVGLVGGGQVVHGLDYLNGVGLMHRDIKPPNLLVNSRGEVKITDFGIGRRLSDARSGLSGDADDAAEDDEEEETGFPVAEKALAEERGVGDAMAKTFVGTRNYMSPERLMGDKYGASADVWSLGLILVEFLTGRHPLEDVAGGTFNLIAKLREVTWPWTAPAPQGGTLWDSPLLV